MITVSYKDFISNSGNIQLEKTEDKLHSLFLVDSKIKLEEMDRVYTIENIEDLIKDISSLLENGDREIDDTIAETEVISNNASCLKMFFYLCMIIYAASSVLSIIGPDKRDFARKYAEKHGITFAEAEYYIFQEIGVFPIQYRKYEFRYQDGTDETVGYVVFGLTFITN
ncbi:hypothetical protein [Parabacteroides goldsteinii]|uniref:hypothetical protein n=1 Tax=Parabacteroides goldsteinii TaxID=328812 RepID=UPI00259B164E|nr:hypothetical protein [Parabacteroides goldsteinii]